MNPIYEKAKDSIMEVIQEQESELQLALYKEYYKQNKVLAFTLGLSSEEEFIEHCIQDTPGPVIEWIYDFTTDKLTSNIFK